MAKAQRVYGIGTICVDQGADGGCQYQQHRYKGGLNLNTAIKRNGSAVPSIVQKLLSAFPANTPDAEDDLHIKLTSATLFGGKPICFPCNTVSLPDIQEELIQ